MKFQSPLPGLMEKRSRATLDCSAVSWPPDQVAPAEGFSDGESVVGIEVVEAEGAGHLVDGGESVASGFYDLEVREFRR